MQKPNRVRPRTAREMPLKIGPIALLPDLKSSSNRTATARTGQVLCSRTDRGMPHSAPVSRQPTGSTRKPRNNPRTAAARLEPVSRPSASGIVPLIVEPRKAATIKPLYSPADGSCAICAASTAPPASQLKNSEANREGSQPTAENTGVITGARWVPSHGANAIKPVMSSSRSTTAAKPCRKALPNPSRSPSNVSAAPRQKNTADIHAIVLTRGPACLH